jgi:hypothetical protein
MNVNDSEATKDVANLGSSCNGLARQLAKSSALDNGYLPPPPVSLPKY